MGNYEENQEALSAALEKVRAAWEDLDTSRRDWNLSGHAGDGEDRPSSVLHMLMVEQSSEASRLCLAATAAIEALERLGFRH